MMAKGLLGSGGILFFTVLKRDLADGIPTKSATCKRNSFLWGKLYNLVQIAEALITKIQMSNQKPLF